MEKIREGGCPWTRFHGAQPISASKSPAAQESSAATAPALGAAVNGTS